MLAILNSRWSDNAFEAPECIETAFELLAPVDDDAASKPETCVTADELDKIASTTPDSNDGVIGSFCGCDVAADGRDIVPLVVEGLRLRLQAPVDRDERLLIARRSR